MSELDHKNFNHLKIHTQFSICEGAIKIDVEVVNDIQFKVLSVNNCVIKVGKRKFLKIIV